MPGSSAREPRRKAHIPIARGWPPNCLNSVFSVAPEIPALVTTRPAAVDTIKAGIWVTSPSPTVSRV